MSALETYIKAVTKERGIIRQRKLINLRWYIKHSKTTELIRAINNITKQQHLKILWEAGLTTPLQRAVANRLQELATRRSRGE